MVSIALKTKVSNCKGNKMSKNPVCYLMLVWLIEVLFLSALGIFGSAWCNQHPDAVSAISLSSICLLGGVIVFVALTDDRAMR